MQHIRPVLEEARRVVLDLLPEVQRLRYNIRWKDDGSPVTEADILIERELGRFLAGRIDGINLIGEETWVEGQAAGEDWFAVLDPIDGTENFCSGLKEWGTSLSIWRGGEHQGSMLLLPELGDCAMSGNIPKVPRSRIVGFSSSFNADIGAGLAQTPEGRIMGCAVYNLYNVLRGAFERFVNPKGAYSWDLLAGVALAHEAGCEVKIEGKDYNGQFLGPGKRYRVDIRHRYDIHSGEGAVG